MADLAPGQNAKISNSGEQKPSASPKASDAASPTESTPVDSPTEAPPITPDPKTPGEEVVNSPLLLEPATMLPLPVTPPPSPPSGYDELFVEPVTGGGTIEPQPVTQGFSYHLHGSARAAYDSNIFIQPDHEEADFIFTLAPGVAFGWGDYETELLEDWSFRERYNPDVSDPDRLIEKSFVYLDYTPSVTMFTHNSEENTFDHDAKLEGQWAMRKLTLGIKARFQTLNIPDVDIGDRQRQRRLNVDLTSLYEASEKTSVEVNAGYSSRDYERSADTREWRNQNWLNYQIQPKVMIGFGPAFGYVESTQGPEQVYEQGLLRVRYKPSEKLSLLLIGGVEARQIRHRDDEVNPVVSLAAKWNPAEGTYLYLSAYSKTLTSSQFAQNYTLTGVDFIFRQRLLQRYYLGVAAGYANADYDSLPGSPSSARNDDLYYIRPFAELDIIRWMSASIAVEYRNNDSSNARRTFEELSAYLQLNVHF